MQNIYGIFLSFHDLCWPGAIDAIQSVAWFKMIQKFPGYLSVASHYPDTCDTGSRISSVTRYVIVIVS